MTVNPTLPIITLSSFLVLAFLSPNNVDNGAIKLGLVLVSFLAGYVRYETLRKTFAGDLNLTMALFAVFSHIILFAALFILFNSDYSVDNPTNVFVDSVYYSTDTTTTNGASGIIPSTGYTKMIHTVNILDSLFIILTMGSFIYAALKSNS